MEEARRFFRYVIPGLVFIVEVLATLLLMDYGKLLDVLKVTKNVGTILGMFVVSGGLGYIFSNIYFFLYWSAEKYHAVNHVDVIKSLNGKLIIKNTDGEDCLKNLDKHKSWVIMNVFWHCRIKESKRIEGINPKNDQMTDITHGLGTTLIASFSAAIMCLFLLSTKLIGFNCSNLGWLLAMWSLLIFPILFQYFRAHKVSQSLVNSTFANEVIVESKDGENPITLTFSE